MCSWCWGFQPSWHVLQQELSPLIAGNQLSIRHLLGGLAKDSARCMQSDAVHDGSCSQCAHRSSALPLDVVRRATAHIQRADNEQRNDQAGAPSGVAGVRHLVGFPAAEGGILGHGRGPYAGLQGRGWWLVRLVAHSDGTIGLSFACGRC